VTTWNTGPLIPRRRLGAAFKQLREAKGETLQQTSGAALFSPSKLSRIENGSAGDPHPRDVRDLIAHFGVDGDDAARLEALAEAGRRPGWWQLPPYEFTGQLDTFISYESAADRIREFSPTLVPGLLQTPRYAEAALTAFMVGESEPGIKRYLDGRLERQRQIQQRASSISRVHVITEAALDQLAHSPKVMVEQLSALLGAFENPSSEIHVIPFRAGLHEGLDLTTTTLFEFASPTDDDIVAIERIGYTEFFDKERTVTKYSAVLDRLSNYWLDTSESRSFIESKQQEWQST
jgi:transcriptional regulator with XRE-family HTH domain